jgi:bifunctional non-homologous end joining protein LigD
MASKGLALYQSKRDFEQTAEPSGRDGVVAAEYPRFVVQKHDATRLHYDLRLELDGVFKSWAVTKGPSTDPKDKRLAVEVEDHPLDYGDFEGTIPKGQYGGGTVMLWDRGFWTPEGTDDPAKALRKGELKFTLAGDKLKGSWVLVRMRRGRDGGKRTNWLLIKHGGDEGADHMLDAAEDDRSVASGRTLAQIARNEGPRPAAFMKAEGSKRPASKRKPGNSKRAAVSTAPGRKSETGLPSFIAPQLCKSQAKPPQGKDWVHEIKLDGYRLQVRVEGGRAQLLTRKGLDWSERFPELRAACAELPDCIIDGEVVALDRNGVPDFAGLQAALSEGGTEDLVYFAFDVLFDRTHDLRALPLTARKQRLREFLAEAGLSETGPVRYLDHLDHPGDAVLQSACRMEFEGIVSKQVRSHYKSGRTESWIKSKCRIGHEVVIGGWSGSTKHLRSLVVGVWRGPHFVYVGRVGTGFNARNTGPLLARLSKLATQKRPFEGQDAPRKMADWTWVEPKLVCEIQYAGWTGAGMVRQAAFKGLREDKPARDVRAETPADAEATPSPAPSSPKRPASGRANGSAVVMGLAISKPDKVLWPEHAAEPPVTKIDLARYYEAVAGWMMPHLVGRPCSIIRAPDGIEGERWFQRHATAGMSNLITSVKVRSEREAYIQFDRAESLIAAAQMGAVELHPWNCAAGEPERPGRLVFDLDPGDDVPFSDVVSAAKDMRERLEALGLEGFCKTTGGKGLHVVTPVTASDSVTWDKAKAFAQVVCAAMAKDSPDRYLVNMAKRLRRGRIYLDYLRNDRTSTAVAVLSPRARPGATVSMPLTWAQARQDLDPARFTIRTVPALLAKTTAWRDYDKATRSLDAAMRKLAGKR